MFVGLDVNFRNIRLENGSLLPLFWKNSYIDYRTNARHTTCYCRTDRARHAVDQDRDDSANILRQSSKQRDEERAREELMDYSSREFHTCQGIPP